MTIVKYQYDELMNPVLQALKLLGGSGTNEEINDKVAELVKIPSDQWEILHNPEKGGMTEIEYRLMWTRTYLKKYGLIDNSSRGIWSLTQNCSTIEKVNEKEVVRMVRELMKKGKQETVEDDDEPNRKVVWLELLDAILKLPPQQQPIIQHKATCEQTDATYRDWEILLAIPISSIWYKSTTPLSMKG
jgi:restriction system protein